MRTEQKVENDPPGIFALSEMLLAGRKADKTDDIDDI